MIKVSSTIKMNMPEMRKLTDAATKALELTGEYLHDEIQQAQVVPRRDGALQGESFFEDTSSSGLGKVSLVHSEPYARRLYFHPEYKFHKEPWEEEWTDRQGVRHHVKHDGNPYAKGKWFEDWMEGGKHEKEAIKAYAEFYRRLTGV